MRKISFLALTMVLWSMFGFALSASAQNPGQIFDPIYHLFNGLFQGALGLIMLFFIIVLVLGLFSAPLWIRKIFGMVKG